MAVLCCAFHSASSAVSLSSSAFGFGQRIVQLGGLRSPRLCKIVGGTRGGFARGRCVRRRSLPSARCGIRVQRLFALDILLRPGRCAGACAGRLRGRALLRHRAARARRSGDDGRRHFSASAWRSGGNWLAASALHGGGFGGDRRWRSATAAAAAASASPAAAARASAAVQRR